MRQLALAAIAWALLSPLSFGQKEYPKRFREALEVLGQLDAINEAGEMWLDSLKQSAATGHVEAQAELGRVYYDGFITVGNKAMKVTRDYSRALELCQKAAGQGHVGAQYTLGQMYRNGSGVSKNYSEASKWHLKAATRGVLGAQYDLGMMYYHGEGVLQDFVQAYAWLNLATARSGTSLREGIVSVRDQIRNEMTPVQVAEAQKLAAELLKRIESLKSE